MSLKSSAIQWNLSDRVKELEDRDKYKDRQIYKLKLENKRLDNNIQHLKDMWSIKFRITPFQKQNESVTEYEESISE